MEKCKRKSVDPIYSMSDIQMDERLSPKDIFDIDLTVLDPVIYSGKYHSLGKLLGEIGDFCKAD